MAGSRVLPVEWKDRGKTVRGMLHLTRKSGAPWFIFSHGFTGHRLGPGYLFVRLSRELAQAGFSSLRFDFAGSGESDGIFPEMTVDSMRSNLLSAVKHIKKNYAPKKIVLIGHSFGGMIAALCCKDIQPDGLVLLAPVGNPLGMVARRAAILETGPNKNGFFENGPHEMALSFLDGMKSIDPVAEFVSAFKGPLLLFQGDCDKSISLKESGLYVHAAKKAGLTVDYHIMKNADHNFSSVSHFKTIFTETMSWAKEHFL